MADDVTFTVAADATPPGGTVAATDETSAGPHTAGAHMGIAKLAISANGDSTHIPATVADGLLVEVSNAGSITFGGLTDTELRATPVPVDVDAPVGQAAMAASIPVVIASNQSAVAVTAAAQPGVDIGDVTVNNAAGAAAVNIQDGGNTITVDGAVTIGAALPAGTNNIGDVDVLSLPALPAGNNNIGDVDIASSVLPTGASTLAEQQTQTASLSVMDDWDESDRAKVNIIVGQAGVAAGTGTDGATVQRVTLATNVGLPAGTNNIGDVDVLTLPSIPAGTNNIGDVDVLSLPAIPAGNNNIGDVDIASFPATALEVVGDVAADAAVPANPVAVGGRASIALPASVSADGDSVYQWLLRNGATVMADLPHLGMIADPYTLTSETAQYTTTQTSAILVAVGTGQTIAVTYVQIQAAATTAGAVQLYFGDGSYNRGNSLAIFDGEFAPSATLKPGFTTAPPKPFLSPVNQDLRVTTSANITVTVTVWYYLIG